MITPSSAKGTELIYDRSALLQSKKDGEVPSYWLAWDPKLEVKDMKKVMYVKVGEITENGKTTTVMRWAKLGSTDYRSGKNIWDPITQLWNDYTS